MSVEGDSMQVLIFADFDLIIFHGSRPPLFNHCVHIMHTLPFIATIGKLLFKQ